LVILVAQAEAEFLKLVVVLTGRTEKEAQKFLQMEAADVKREILPLVYASGIEDGARQELCDNVIEEFFRDRERRHPLIHGEWYVSLSEQPPQATAMIRRVPRKKGVGVTYGAPTPEEIWDLASCFREYRMVFSHALYVLCKDNGLASDTDASSDDRP
jgi:hypothetical protein